MVMMMIAFGSFDHFCFSYFLSLSIVFCSCFSVSSSFAATTCAIIMCYKLNGVKRDTFVQWTRTWCFNTWQGPFHAHFFFCDLVVWHAIQYASHFSSRTFFDTYLLLALFFLYSIGESLLLDVSCHNDLD